MADEEDERIRESASLSERFAIAFALGLFGILIGMLVWWVMPRSLGFFRVAIKLAGILGACCFVIGWWRPHATLEFLGSAGKKIIAFSSEVLSWFRLIR